MRSSAPSRRSRSRSRRRRSDRRRVRSWTRRARPPRGWRASAGTQAWVVKNAFFVFAPITRPEVLLANPVDGAETPLHGTADEHIQSTEVTDRLVDDALDVSGLREVAGGGDEDASRRRARVRLSLPGPTTRRGSRRSRRARERPRRCAGPRPVALSVTKTPLPLKSKLYRHLCTPALQLPWPAARGAGSEPWSLVPQLPLA